MSDVDDDVVLSDAEVDEEVHQDGAGEDEKIEVCPLTQEAISEGLSLLCRTSNGLGHAFVKLDLREKRLTDIAIISGYIHLHFLDMSHNYLSDLSPLASLTQLLWLKVDSNVVKHFKGQPFEQLVYLQRLSMATNQLTDLDNLVGPSLESLNLTGNSIHRVDGLQNGCFDNLVTLELRGNQLDTIDINLPSLQHLYLAQNSIKSLEGLERLQLLTTLHVRDNQLGSLEGLSPNMKCLKYLNVRGNVIIDESALHSLGQMSKSLTTLVIAENPVVEMTDFRIRVLILMPQLERLDKDPITPEERTEAQERLRELKERSNL